VVFVRLYWFEKRFNSIVLEAQNNRRTKDRTRSKSEVNLEHDIDSEEKAVGKRNIVARRPGEEKINTVEKTGSNKSSDNSPGTTSSDTEEGNSEIQNFERMPTQRAAETHIAFLENQRNPKDKDILYIPGPREFDRGDVPQHIEDDVDPLDSTFPRKGQKSLGRDNEPEDGVLDHNDENTKTHISFGDSVPAIFRANHGAMSDIKDRGPSEAQSWKEDDDEDSPMNVRKRTRTKTFASLIGRGSQDEPNPMPYLSYQPTIGRNSAFVNLSQEQREELGGIEYRALRTLAVVLCCKSLRI